MIRNIGVPGVEAPERVCEDEFCPFHGHLKVRGRILTGIVVSTKMQKSIVIKRNYNYYVQKYQRYERRNTKQTAHKPECMDVSVGDTVRIMECRPISKTIAFVLIDVVKRAVEG